ncbi:MAG: hypothetical protein RBG1_1C00001G1376 [candidate division Zixibacteria bacterium RBG-1]|nr:MAG: hypothetical protein RBG1_1C00001G1376 [candidate division Zixibacteria bacterium RBG-1]
MNHKNNSIHSELIKKLDQIIAEKNLLKHPFYQMWSQGKLSLEALRNYAKQYYHLVSVFPTFISGVHSNCPDLQSRQKLLSNLMDEELGEKNHPELWLRFCDGLGLRREEVLDEKALPEIKQLIKTFTNLTGRKSYQEGTAALYAYESQVPEIAESKIKGLKQFYGIKYPSCLEFFTVHQEGDVLHARSSRQILDRTVTKKSQEEKVQKAVAELSQSLWDFLSAIYERYVNNKPQANMQPESQTQSDPNSASPAAS